MDAAMTTTVEIPTSVVDAVREARAARDAGIDQVESSQHSELNRALIDRVIDAWARTGEKFSANDLRHLDLDVPSALLGARFSAAANSRKVIRFVGYVTSTKKNTHAKPVGLWVGIPTEGAHA